MKEITSKNRIPQNYRVTHRFCRCCDTSGIASFSVPQLLDAARVLLNAIVDLQNTSENDWASLVDARAARCDRTYGDSPLAATRPLLACETSRPRRGECAGIHRPRHRHRQARHELELGLRVSISPPRISPIRSCHKLLRAQPKCALNSLACYLLNQQMKRLFATPPSSCGDYFHSCGRASVL